MSSYDAGSWSGSTAKASLAFKGAFSTTLAWTHAAISSGQFGLITIASSVADIQPGDLLSVTPSDTMAGPYAFAGYRQSTANASRVTVLLTTPGSTATSTLSGTLRITWVDLT